jgi:hypothetical protein
MSGWLVLDSFGVLGKNGSRTVQCGFPRSLTVPHGRGSKSLASDLPGLLVGNTGEFEILHGIEAAHSSSPALLRLSL